MKFNIENKRGFSLVEVMMTLLILSIVMVLMAPTITKKVSARKTEGVVFTYKNDNVSDSNKCFVLNAGGTTLSSSTNCSEYTFTPPNGVTLVNLTLVGGGGGGGGAAGGVVETFVKTSSSTYNPDKIRDITINYLAAKGTAGGAVNTNCADNTAGTICAGKGGKSSMAIFNFSVPDTLYKTASNIILAADNAASISTSVTTTGTPYSEIVMSNISYRVNSATSSENSTVSCRIGGTSSSYVKNTESGFTNCKVSSNNIMPSKDGNFGYYLKKNLFSAAYVGKILQGGAGGNSGDAAGSYGVYGTGGTGANYTITSCNASNCTGTAGTASDGGAGYAAYSYSLEHPGGVGGGGAGGSAVKILGVPVDSSKTYVIRVGRGGEGGIGGITGLTATAGSNGKGGVTTSIWEKTGANTETLLYMVAGGAPGYGGSVRTSGERGTSGASGRNYPTLIASSDRLSKVVLDKNISSVESGDKISSPVASTSSTRISYPFINNKSPYKTLNYNNNGNESTTVDGRTGGYSAFRTSNTLNYIQAATINSTTKENAYDGFYYRTIVGNRAAYVGGLGGFSGLGTKAGCGGLFMANANGMTQKAVTNPDNSVTKTNSNSDIYINKFLIPAETGVTYDVGNYYSNCSLANVNGQSAKFVLPDAVTSDLGQAGSGGGGGGYITFQTPGNGGGGQDGYLMINWRR